jgi:hypothetical protein
MARGISIHIGLNRVDSSVYQDEHGNPWDGHLEGCENDARAMKAIADELHYDSTLLLNEDATSDGVITALGTSAQGLTGGDILLVTYSGHGGQVPDVNGDESDGKDETWVLYDRMLVDDELYQLWAQFEKGVRIFMLSDSCHSGTVARVRAYEQLAGFDAAYRPRGAANRTPRFRAVPAAVQAATYRRFKRLYDTRQWAAVRGRDANVEASILLISGCLDNQLSSDGETNGLFTEKLLEVWDKGAFDGSYSQMWKQILDKMPASQSPNLFKTGLADPDFEDQVPFTITAGGAGGGAHGGGHSGRPSVRGPESIVRSQEAPAFEVDPGPNTYYVFEITSRPDLFANVRDAERTGENFYATWKDPDQPSRLQGSTYNLPENAWEQLKGADRLYYRIGSTSSPAGGWDNYMVSTGDQEGESAPSLRVVDQEERAGRRA